MNTSREAEFDEFVRTRGAALTRFAYLVCGDTVTAQDLVQSALAKTWRRRLEPGTLNAYTRAVIVNEQRQWYRWRRRRAETVVAEPPDRPGADQYGRVDELDRLRVALLRLTPRRRAVIVLRYFEDLTEAQTAEILGCSVGTVKSQTSRGLARLRDLLGADQSTVERTGSW